MIYKILNHDGTAQQGIGSWHLPEGKRPGKWMEPIQGDLAPCKNGYHLCRETDLIEWLGPAIFEAEYRGEMIEASNKIVAREARLIRKYDGWNETTARLFAADCAEHVLPIFEKHHHDDRPRRAIEAARAYARGEIDDTARAVAGAAAKAAAKTTSWIVVRVAAGLTVRALTEDPLTAVRAAVWVAAESAAGLATRAAAGVAVRAAAGAAARAAAGVAEQKWQRKRLLEYLNNKAT